MLLKWTHLYNLSWKWKDTQLPAAAVKRSLWVLHSTVLIYSRIISCKMYIKHFYGAIICQIFVCYIVLRVYVLLMPKNITVKSAENYFLGFICTRLNLFEFLGSSYWTSLNICKDKNLQFIKSQHFSTILSKGNPCSVLLVCGCDSSDSSSLPDLFSVPSVLFLKDAFFSFVMF